ncbi:MAG: TerB family tellurite resistance protein [Pseudomonadales bacterium]|nr:TerB family tellurite resistance protein [Pseudomonadales bacterium]
MLATIERFFRDRLQGREGSDGGLAVDALPLACAALMFEVMRADRSIDASERERLRALLRAEFDLEAADLDAVEMLAEQQVEEAVDLYQFTRLIAAHTGVAERIALVEQLWQIAFADGELDAFEEHTIRRVAGLLHVRHSDLIAAKQRARG